MKRPATRRPLTTALATIALACCATPSLAEGASWHVVSGFGRHGVAGLPLRERSQEERLQGAPPPPERYRSLLLPGPQGSMFVGGHANSRPGAFLIAHISSSGRLVRNFGSGGVLLAPALAWFKQAPPRMLALPGGGLLVVGVTHSDSFAAVRIDSRGKLDSAFGHDGVAQYKLTGVHGFAIVTAATMQAGGKILAVYEQELPQPVNQPRVPEGQGNSEPHYLRLLSSGALDRSFAAHGFLAGSGKEVGLLEGESGTVGPCAETLSGSGSLLVAWEGNALEEFSPAGAFVASFGNDPIAAPAGQQLPTYMTKNGYHLCNGLFALPDGAIEGADGRQLVRLTPNGAPDETFGAAGIVRVDTPVQAAAVASDGETFAVGRAGNTLVLTGVLADGVPDAALAGAHGERFAVPLPKSANGEEPTWEVVPSAGGITIRVGEELMRLSN
jgi:hypothetical protein